MLTHSDTFELREDSCTTSRFGRGLHNIHICQKSSRFTLKMCTYAPGSKTKRTKKTYHMSGASGRRIRGGCLEEGLFELGLDRKRSATGQRELEAHGEETLVAGTVGGGWEWREGWF